MASRPEEQNRLMVAPDTESGKPAIWAAGAWETPLGALAVDEDLAQELIRAGAGAEGEAPHLGDNAIELQTPFLRHCFPNARIVPIATPSGTVAAIPQPPVAIPMPAPTIAPTVPPSARPPASDRAMSYWSADSDWKKYRYRVFETIIPLRNVIWAKNTL